ncbi:MAG TPA: lysophospholipid acyltransferase family protein [Solirubrobacterales bacterium]|nr:lysophospholipid acyltransferase family protein [Solirubrobacterales bacterium]
MSEIKPQNYKDERPAEYFRPFHDRARNHDPGWTYELVRMITTPISLFIYRCRAVDVSNVPADGPVILAANHFSNMDHFLAGAYLRRKIRFLAKSQLYANRIGNYIFSVGGVIPIRRGHRDEEAFESIRAAFRRGGCVMIYIEGGRSRSGELGSARPGVGRAALESGVPVVPVAIHGSQRIRRWKRLQFPKVTVRFGRPMRFEPVAEASREQQQECAEEVFTKVKHMYRELEQEGRATVIKRARAQRREAGSSYS